MHAHSRRGSRVGSTGHPPRVLPPADAGQGLRGGAGEGGRHLFALYVVAQGLGVEAQFLKDFLGLQYKLSTSQIPQRQTEMSLSHLPFREALLSPSGGFGPVADDGYGVSYMMADDTRTFFHISSKRSAGNTDSERFRKAIWQARAPSHPRAALPVPLVP